jgi:hypothetical protein
MGSLLGFLCSCGLVAAAWEGSLQPFGIAFFVIAAIAGAFLFPYTVGTFMTMVMSGSIFAILAGLVSGHPGSALTALGIGVGAFLTQFFVGSVRGI